MSQEIKQLNRNKLFLIGVLALFTASMANALRATVAGDIKTTILDPIDILQSATMIAQALGVSFLGFAITLFVVSPLLDVIGMKRTLLIAAGTTIGGTLLVVFSQDLSVVGDAYTYIWSGMLMCGVGWGCVEGTINPMTTALYPEDKTHRLNVLHAWFPGGMIAGGLAGVALSYAGVSWKVALCLPIISALAFVFMLFNTEFPKTERAQNGVSMKDMMLEIVRRPSFLLWFFAMFLTAASELAPGQWVDLALSQKVGFRGILLMVYVSGLMFVMRHFAGPIAHRLSNPGLLWVSSLLAAGGLYLLSIADGPVSAMLAATAWGAGVCFMWPTMLASVAERYPDGGSWLIGLIGSAGALSIYFVLPVLGGIYDQAKMDFAGGKEQLIALQGDALAEVEGMAASMSFEMVAYIPLGLLVIFGAIWAHDRRTIDSVKSLQNNET